MFLFREKKNGCKNDGFMVKTKSNYYKFIHLIEGTVEGVTKTWNVISGGTEHI